MNAVPTYVVFSVWIVMTVIILVQRSQILDARREISHLRGQLVTTRRNNRQRKPRRHLLW